MSALTPPPPVATYSPWVRLGTDLLEERRAARRDGYPPGETWPSLRRTRRFNYDPMPLLVEGYERYGPVFTMRVFHGNVVFLIGPEANHFVLVSGAQNFRWRDGHMGDLIPLLGDGLLTIDGDFHRRSRKIMLPAFHKEAIAAALSTMGEEIEAALDGDAWRPGSRLDLYAWTRRLAMRIAMRALFGLSPEGGAARRTDAAEQMERALSYYAADYFLQVLRGPKTPWRRMHESRERLDGLIFDEIARRRRTGERGGDLLSLLLDAHDEDGGTLPDQAIRDEVMTLLFAGHDTTTSTITFLFHLLAGHPEHWDAVATERDAVLGDREPTAGELMGGALPALDRAIDETLRLFPPAWVGPRKSANAFDFAGHRVPAGVPVNYSSWVTHHLPDVWPDPEAFRPERFTAENRKRIPRGAYVPFGGGSRICIGMRFGQLEIRAIAAAILRRARLEHVAGHVLRVRQMPTIGPRDGLPVVVRAREAEPTLVPVG